jgi:peptide-methionine (R)-S-oxide reductase
MQKSNPRFVLRNHLGETVIRAAQAGDFAPVQQMLAVLQRLMTRTRTTLTGPASRPTGLPRLKSAVHHELSHPEIRPRMASPVAGQGRRSRGLPGHAPRSHRAPFTGKYEQFWADGSYHCICCGNKLFDSHTKFDAGCGWPSFDQAVPGAITNIVDRSHGMVRTETVCSNCGAHLGHVFPDGPTDTGLRYCMNSASLDFQNEPQK